jgi:hypothetical protein
MRNMNRMLAAGTAALAVGYAAPPAMADCATADRSVLLATGKNVLRNNHISALVLNLYNPLAILQVNDPQIGAEIINPDLVVCDGHIDGYIGRPSPDSVEEITANQAQLTEYIGNKAIGIRDPRQAGVIVRRTLWPTPLKGSGTVGFTDGRNGYGIMP